MHRRLFVGQLIGSSLSSRVFLKYGARPYYGLNLGMVAFSLITLAARGPVFDNKKWLGWGKRNEWAIRKPRVKKVNEDQEMGTTATQDARSSTQPSGKDVIAATDLDVSAKSPVNSR